MFQTYSRRSFRGENLNINFNQKPFYLDCEIYHAEPVTFGVSLKLQGGSVLKRVD